jgi:tetratricopeptide (TPR) repeat protein
MQHGSNLIPAERLIKDNRARMADDGVRPACLSETTIVGFLERRLPSDAIDAVDAHVDRCVSCRLVLAELARGLPDLGALASRLATDVCTRTPADADTLPRGTVVGRFVILDVLGIGGMGIVYTAYDPELNRNVALKLLHASIALDPERQASTQLRNEARVMAQIQHGNVVTVHEVGAFRDHVFIAMEHVDGVTLRRWMDVPRTWREVVTVFVRAGEGLAAAHQAGVIHRDFKPENVLIGDDGRVRVSDFGIAATLKRDSAVIAGGTPAYMAPESLRAEGDARSDQFSFCIAFHEALYGIRPFAARGVDDFTEEVRRGPPPEDRVARVPKQVRAVLRRGLALEPHDRYPSMRDLLADLRHRLEVRQRVAIAAAAIGLVGVAVGATILIAPGHTAGAPRPCSGARDRLAGAWDLPRKIVAQSAFLATALPYAPVAFDRAAARLDRYADEWVATRTGACEATEVRREQSAALRDLRMSCLEDLAIRMRVIADAFAHADAPTVRDASAIADSLPPIGGCADTKALLAVIPPPPDPVVRARIDSLLSSVTEASALLDAGKPPAASARIDGLDAEVTAIGYAPLTARHAFLRGRLASWGGDVAAARRLFKHAAAEAEAGGIDEIKVGALLKAAQFAEAAGDGDDTERMLGDASATSRRLGMPPGIEADLAQSRGRVLHAAGNYTEALSHRRRALALSAQVHGAGDVHTANARIDVAETLRMLSREGDALVEADRAAHDLDAELGADHPDAATAHAMHAMLRFDQGHSAEALAESDLAYHRLVAVLGPRHPDLAGAVTVAGNAHLALHHYDTAIELLQRAVDLTQEAYGPDHPVVRGARLGLAQGQLRAHRSRDAMAELTRLLEAPARAGAPQDFLDGMALVGLGSALLAERNTRAAVARCEQGVRILEAQLGRRNIETAAALGELGHAVSSFDVRRGVKLLEEAVEIELAVLGTRDPRTATDRARLGKLLYQTGDRARGHRLVAEVHELLAGLGEQFDAAELAGWLQQHVE